MKYGRLTICDQVTYRRAQVYSVQGLHQAGIALEDSRIRAGYWSGSAKSWIDLDSPDFEFGSVANAVDGNVIVGESFHPDMEGGDVSRATMWFADTGQYINLHPDFAESSRAHAAFGRWQAGEIRVNDDNHAAIWNGTATSVIDLNPPKQVNSYILGMHGDLQVGYAQGPLSHACTWRGDVESWVDLHPEIAFASQGNGTDGVQQVGWTIFLEGNVIDHPALWQGTAESYIDLLPTAWRDGKALGVWQGRQTGYARRSLNGGGDDYRALVWSGAADDFVDLHSFLPAGQYLRSFGYDIWNDDQTWFVVGQAIREDDSPDGLTSDPILWTSPILMLGDLNQDSVVNLLDVEPFVDSLTSGVLNPAADINCDGSTDLLDVAPFISLIVD